MVDSLAPGFVWSRVVRVLPEVVLEQLETAKGSLSDLRWTMGRLANICYSYVVANALPFSRVQTCAAIGHFFDDVRSMSSILRYAEAAEFYPDEIVEAYGFLPFSHFDYARRFGDRWREVLDESVRLADERGGLPGSVLALERVFEPELFQIHALEISQEMAAAEGVAPAADGVPPASDYPEDEQDLPDEPPTDYDEAVACDRDLFAVSHSVDQLTSVLPRLQRWAARYPGAARKLAQAQLLISEVVEEIRERQTQ